MDDDYLDVGKMVIFIPVLSFFFFLPIILSSFMSGNTSKKKNFPNQLFGFSEVFDLYRKGRINT